MCEFNFNIVMYDHDDVIMIIWLICLTTDPGPLPRGVLAVGLWFGECAMISNHDEF